MRFIDTSLGHWFDLHAPYELQLVNESVFNNDKGGGARPHRFSAASLNERIVELNNQIVSLRESLEGTDSTDGIIARYEDIIAELTATNTSVTERMAEIIAQNTQLREDNIAIKTRIENLQTNYASQLSSIQALNTRVDALRSVSVTQVANEEVSQEP